MKIRYSTCAFCLRDLLVVKYANIITTYWDATTGRCYIELADVVLEAMPSITFISKNCRIATERRPPNGISKCYDDMHSKDICAVGWY